MHGSEYEASLDLYKYAQFQSAYRGCMAQNATFAADLITPQPEVLVCGPERFSPHIADAWLRIKWKKILKIVKSFSPHIADAWLRIDTVLSGAGDTRFSPHIADAWLRIQGIAGEKPFRVSVRISRMHGSELYRPEPNKENEFQSAYRGCMAQNQPVPLFEWWMEFQSAYRGCMAQNNAEIQQEQVQQEIAGFSPHIADAWLRIRL